MWLAKYGDVDNFLVANNPERQLAIARDAQECFFGSYPTLAKVTAVYGNNAATMWLIPQLLNLSEYCGCRDKISTMQLKELAAVIANDFFYLKTSELMLFFHRFKAGRYGIFYGSVDPMKITSALHDFVSERATAIDKHETEQRQQKAAEESKDAITWEEYCQRNGIDEKQNPLERIKQITR